MHYKHVSLIASVYNKPDILQLVFAACARQSFKEFEVIIADDGSGPAVKEVIEEAKQKYDFPIIHVWHEDIGWRKNRVLNRGILASGSNYLVFMDGDCLPAKDFLADHWSQREFGKVLIGRRVEMSERWSRSLTVEKVKSGKFEKLGLREWTDGLMGKAAYLEDGIRIASKLLRKLTLRSARGMLGSNFSLYKSDLLAINGFDELYDGPGLGEDSDIQYRLSLNGVKSKSIRNLAIQFHVYHPRIKVSEKSIARFQSVKAQGESRCQFGIENLANKS